MKAAGKKPPVRGRRCEAPGCSNHVSLRREEPFCRQHLDEHGIPSFDEPAIVFDHD